VWLRFQDSDGPGVVLRLADPAAETLQLHFLLHLQPSRRQGDIPKDGHGTNAIADDFEAAPDEKPGIVATDNGDGAGTAVDPGQAEAVAFQVLHFS
jgi:hypothetical protein